MSLLNKARRSSRRGSSEAPTRARNESMVDIGSSALNSLGNGDEARQQHILASVASTRN